MLRKYTFPFGVISFIFVIRLFPESGKALPCQELNFFLQLKVMKLKRETRKLLVICIKAGLGFLIIIMLSPPVNIISFKTPEEYLKGVEKLCSYYSQRMDFEDYYLSLEKDPFLFRLVLSQLKDKERFYFLQMRPFLKEIAKASQKTGIPIFSLASHIKRESQFNPWAVSSQGAYGLMGVTVWAYKDVLRLREKKKWVAEALEEYGDFSWEEVKTDPELNIVVGAIYYRFLLDEFKDTTLASLAYNWGIGNVTIMQEKYGDVKNILARLKELASLNKAWMEPARYPVHISRFETVFQRVDEKIKATYFAFQEVAQERLISLEENQAGSSS